MQIEYAKLKSWAFPELEQRYTERDTILHALSVGCGHDPTDTSDLRYVYDDELQALPTLGVVLGCPGFCLKNPETGVDWAKVWPVEQGLVLHRPLPVSGGVAGRCRVNEILDKGAGRDALLYAERELLDAASGERVCTVSSTILLRGQGGFGGFSGPAPEPHPVPEAAPDLTLDLPTTTQAALICRLSGHYDAPHANPALTIVAGFPQPVLQGRTIYGIACRAILRACCHDDPARLESLHARFTAPVFPGETIRTEMWCDGTRITFRCRVVGRNTVVLNNGLAIVDC